MWVFNPDRFFKRRTIFSSENFDPEDQNFEDQNSRDRSRSQTTCGALGIPETGNSRWSCKS